MRNVVLSVLFLVGCAFGQATNSACPSAVGTLPHCVNLAWTAPISGPAPLAYNLYTGGTKSGQCTPSPLAATCTRIGTVAAGILLFTYNSTATAVLAEGSTYFFVATSVNGTAESAPSAEASATIPFLVPDPPASFTAVGK